MTAPALPDWSDVPSRRDILDRIDRLDVSADAKLLLAKIATTTMEVGGRIIEAGRRIVSFVFDLLKKFPNTAFGVIIALVVTSLIASIPVLGLVLGPLLSPLLLAFGLTAGAVRDMKDGALRRRVADLEAEFRTIAA